MKNKFDKFFNQSYISLALSIAYNKFQNPLLEGIKLEPKLKKKRAKSINVYQKDSVTYKYQNKDINTLSVGFNSTKKTLFGSLNRKNIEANKQMLQTEVTIPSPKKKVLVSTGTSTDNNFMYFNTNTNMTNNEENKFPLESKATENNTKTVENKNLIKLSKPPSSRIKLEKFFIEPGHKRIKSLCYEEKNTNI